MIGDDDDEIAMPRGWGCDAFPAKDEPWLADVSELRRRYEAERPLPYWLRRFGPAGFRRQPDGERDSWLRAGTTPAPWASQPTAETRHRTIVRITLILWRFHLLRFPTFYSSSLHTIYVHNLNINPRRHLPAHMSVHADMSVMVQLNACFRALYTHSLLINSQW